MVFIKSGDLLKNVLWLQFIGGIGAMLMLFTLGLMGGWTSPYIAKMTAKNSQLSITMEEASWVASLFNFGRFAGAIIGGVSVSYIDSKRTLNIIGFPVLFSWICIIVANSVIWLYIARLIAGISLGMSFSSFPLYLGEISSPTIRGTLVSLAMSGMVCGNLIGNIMGAYLTMSEFASICLVPNVVFILLFLWIPQSPHFLVRNGRMEDAKESIARYNPNVDPKIEVESLRNFITVAESLTFRDRLREFNIPRNRKAGFIIVMLYLFMQMSGLNSVFFYMETILTNAMVDVIPPATLVMTASASAAVSGWLATYIADKFERKVLIIASSATVGITLTTMGVHFALLDNGFDPDKLQWLMIISILIFAFAVCNGITTVPGMLLSEFFAPNIKNLAACFASILLGLFAFTSTKTYQPLVDLIGEAYLFWAYASVMFLCVIFCAITLPATKGKSLQEIQDMLTRK